MKLYIGIDNGVTGTIGFINEDGTKRVWFEAPVKKELNYTRAKVWIERIDVPELVNVMHNMTLEYQSNMVHVVLERPFVNPKGFRATVSAMRALEATLIALESLGFSYEYIDSRTWQHALLPHGLPSNELKKASLAIGRRLWPELQLKRDADGLLIAEFARRCNR